MNRKKKERKKAWGKEKTKINNNTILKWKKRFEV
jgi:hypothetical protein